MAKKVIQPEPHQLEKIELFKKYRQLFEDYLEANNLKSADLEYAERFHTCPGCAFPTLHERREFEVCSICNWEDDGQDDNKANEVWGGSNGDTSLTQHRLLVMEVLERAYEKYTVDPASFLTLLKAHFEVEEKLAEELLDKDEEEAMKEWEKLNESFIEELIK